MSRILVLGGGFAGLWSAIGAARLRDEIGATVADVEILLVDRQNFHNIRVRNYEADLSDVAIPLGEILDPIGVNHRVADVRSIDPQEHTVAVATAKGDETLRYDRLILALGSRLPRPSFPGASLLFDVDTYEAGLRLANHLATLSKDTPTLGRETVVVVGAAFTGIEVASEMTERLRQAFGSSARRVVLIDRNTIVGTGYGDEARAILEDSLGALGVEVRLGVEIAQLEAAHVHLTSGERIAARTVVWCAGMQPSSLAAALPAAHDEIGRLVVDEFMRVADLPDLFAAGDAAASRIDGTHPTVMSCQHARPMGRFAGHNAMADLIGQPPLLPLCIDWYVTVLDLGTWGALYTVGRDRKVLAAGPAAKVVKQTINRDRIYPPRGGSRTEILAAGAPIVQAPPEDVRLALQTNASP